MTKLFVWVAIAETDMIHDTAIFHSAEGAKAWCDEMINKYHKLDILPKWYISEGSGSLNWQPNQSFFYSIHEVLP